MRIGKRPYDRHNALILDLFGKLNQEEDGDKLSEAIKSAKERDPKPQAILLELENLSSIDARHLSLLGKLQGDLKESEIRLVIVRPFGNVRIVLGNDFEIVENEADAFRPELDRPIIIGPGDPL